MSKILVVDDDVAIAQLISDALEDEGFDTVIKNDSRSAYEYVMEKEFLFSAGTVSAAGLLERVCSTV